MSYGDTVPAVKKPRRSPVRIRRDEACRRIASKITRGAPWVTPLDTLAIRAFAQLERLAIEAFERLKDDGMFAADGSPHPALDKYARLRQVQIQLSDRLGLNPKSRAEMQSARDAPIDLKILEAASERMERVHVQRYGHKNGPNRSSN